MQSLTTKLTLIVCMLGGPFLGACNGQVTLGWNPSPDPTTAGYYLCWGLNSGAYTSTNVYTTNQTSVTVSTLASNTAYFFAVQAFSANGLVSPFSNEVNITNEPASTNMSSPTNIGSPSNTTIVYSYGQVLLTWSPCPDPNLAGYFLCSGTISGVYTVTNICAQAQTNAMITNLSPNTVYFFALQAFSSNGMVSPFSNEICVSNGLPSGQWVSSNMAPIFVESTNSPPMPGSGSGSPPIVSGNGGTGSVSGSAGANYGSSFWGVPPFLAMAVSDGQPSLYVGGTVGATLMIEATTNPASSDTWETMTNVTLTNIALFALSNQAAHSPNALDLAFAPAAEVFPISPSNLISFQILRAVMAYDYVILGSIVLKNQGYEPRLVVVNMPGIVSDDTCYVNEGSSFIHYDSSTATLQLEGSGPSIRQIATTLATSLDLNWTSASEFTYSNGLSHIVATVIETEPPSSDPAPGKRRPGKATVIDF